MKYYIFFAIIITFGSKGYSATPPNKLDQLHIVTQKAFKELDLNQLSELNQKIISSKIKINNQSSPIEIKGGLGQTLVGDYIGPYQEVEMTYEIELSGKRKKYKSVILPLLKKIQKWDTVRDLNHLKFDILQMIMAKYILNEKVDHALKRKSRLQKIQLYLKNIKLNSPQSLADKNLVSLQIEELEYEIKVLQYEQQKISSLLSHIFGKKFDLKLSKRSPSYIKLERILKKIQLMPSFINDYHRHELKVLQLKKDMAQNSWIPDLIIYAGQNKQDQLGTQPQITKYAGLGLRIATDFTFRNKRTLSESELEVAKIMKEREKINYQKSFMALESQIHKKMSFIELNKRNLFHQKELELTKHFNNLSKGLIHLQSYLEIDNVIHERFHKTLQFKQELIQDFTNILHLKKQPLDILGELL